MAPSCYVGYTPSKDEMIAREKSDMDPSVFYTKYVKARRPVILAGFPKGDEGCRLQNLGSLRYLQTAARNSAVKIEPFNKNSRTFGTNLERRSVPFPDFLDLMRDEEERGQWYLTTQYDEEDEAAGTEELPSIDRVCPAPTDKLVHDFPARPTLMGNLVLQQCNLWIGNSKEGSSSGLHHDFHDNLYLLLRGRKRFLLYPPSAYPYLHLRGSVEKLWGNGLVCYSQDLVDQEFSDEDSGADAIRADGLTQEDALRWRCAFWLHKIAELTDEAPSKATLVGNARPQRIGWPYDQPAYQTLREKEGSSLLSGPMKKAVAACAKAFEKLSEVTGVDYESDPEGCSGDRSDAVSLEKVSQETDSEDEDELPLFGDPDADDSWSENEGVDDADGLLDALDLEVDLDRGHQQIKPDPPSFSRIAPDALHRHLGLTDESGSRLGKTGKKTKKDKHSESASRDQLLPLKGCPPPLVVHLEPGEMLYLPTSWFHEVTSSSDRKGEDNVHIAFNYWFHPPDAYLSSPNKDTFKHPYADTQSWTAISREVAKQFSNLRASLVQEDTTKGHSDKTKRTRGALDEPGTRKSQKRRVGDLPARDSQQPKGKNRPKPLARARKLRWATRIEHTRDAV